MNPVNYIKQNGIKHTWDVFYEYKADILIQKFLMLFLRDKPLRDIIVIESHNDFDCNGGAFYDYLIDHGYNKKYKIVWLIKNTKLVPDKLPKNVEWVALFKPNIKKNYYKWIAKYFTSDCCCTPKLRRDQLSVFCSHGLTGFKKVKGKMTPPDSIDCILMPSENFAPIAAEQLNLEYPNKKFVYVGYPVHDLLYNSDRKEILKITSQKYRKIIIWMPTFRRGITYKRNDSKKEQALGVPILNTDGEYKTLNSYLRELNVLLIIKIHPMQDLCNLKITDQSNIRVLTGIRVKELHIDNYRLLSCTDAMISDYSSAASEYLQLNRPIAYSTDDMEVYKLGFIVDDIHSLMAGPEIKNLCDMMEFIKDVVDEKDDYEEKRLNLRKYFFKYHDNHCCERLAKLMGIENIS